MEGNEAIQSKSQKTHSKRIKISYSDTLIWCLHSPPLRSKQIRVIFRPCLGEVRWQSLSPEQTWDSRLRPYCKVLITTEIDKEYWRKLAYLLWVRLRLAQLTLPKFESDVINCYYLLFYSTSQKVWPFSIYRSWIVFHCTCWSHKDNSGSLIIITQLFWVIFHIPLLSWPWLLIVHRLGKNWQRNPLLQLRWSYAMASKSIFIY